MTDSFNRRDFIRTTALAGSALALSAQTTTPASEGWFDKPMRWAQLTLVEDDPGKYDLAFWLDYFKKTHSDAACLSAGGSVAFYPTKIPLHYRSQWLKDTDPFGDLVAGCRKQNMVVIARTDPPAAHQWRLRGCRDCWPIFLLACLVIMKNPTDRLARHDRQAGSACRIFEQVKAEVNRFSADGLAPQTGLADARPLLEESDNGFRAVMPASHPNSRRAEERLRQLRRRCP